MVNLAAPIRVTVSRSATSEDDAGELEIHEITLNSVSFYRGDAGALFLRGYSEAYNRLIDLPANRLRFE